MLALRASVTNQKQPVLACASGWYCIISETGHSVGRSEALGAFEEKVGGMALAQCHLLSCRLGLRPDHFVGANQGRVRDPTYILATIGAKVDGIERWPIVRSHWP